MSTLHLLGSRDAEHGQAVAKDLGKGGGQGDFIRRGGIVRIHDFFSNVKSVESVTKFNQVRGNVLGRQFAPGLFNYFRKTVKQALQNPKGGKTCFSGALRTRRRKYEEFASRRISVLRRNKLFRYGFFQN